MPIRSFKEYFGRSIPSETFDSFVGKEFCIIRDELERTDLCGMILSISVFDEYELYIKFLSKNGIVDWFYFNQRPEALSKLRVYE